MSMDKERQVKVLARGRTLALGTLGQNETPAAQVGFELLEPFNGMKTMAWAGFLTSAAEERTVESLQAMGWAGNDPEELEGLMEDGKLSKVVELVIGPEMYKGKEHWKIAFVNAVGGRVKRMGGDALADVKARLKQRIGEVARPAPASGATPPAQAPSQGTSPDDNIPF